MLQLLGTRLFHTTTSSRPYSRYKLKTGTNTNNFNTTTSTRNHLPNKVRANHNSHHNRDTGHASIVRRISSFWNLHQTCKESAVVNADRSIHYVLSSASRLSFWNAQQFEFPTPLNFPEASWLVSFLTRVPSNEREAPNGCLNLPTELLIEVLKECMWQMEREGHPRVGFASHNPPLVLRSVCKLWNECFEEHTSLQLFVKATFSNKECTQLFPRQTLSKSVNPIKEIIETDTGTYRLCSLALAFDDWSCYISNNTFKDILELVPRSTSLQVSLPNGQHPLFPPDPATITTSDTLLESILARLEASSDLRSLLLKWDQNLARPFVLNGAISVHRHAGFLWKQLQHINVNCRLSLGACHGILNTCSEQLVTASLGLVNRGDLALRANEITLPNLKNFAMQTSRSISKGDLVSFFDELEMPSLKEINFQLGLPNLAVANFPLAWDQITTMVLRCSISQANLRKLFQKLINVVTFELYGNESYSSVREKANISLPHLTRLIISADPTAFAPRPFESTINGLLAPNISEQLASIQVPFVVNLRLGTSLRIVNFECPINRECCAQTLRDPGFQNHISHATFYLTPDLLDTSTIGAAISIQNLETLTLYSDTDCHQLIERITVNSERVLKISIIPWSCNMYDVLPRISGM